MFLQVNTVRFSVVMCISNAASKTEVRKLYHEYLNQNKLNIEMTTTIRSLYWYVGVHVPHGRTGSAYAQLAADRAAAVSRCLNLESLSMKIECNVYDVGELERMLPLQLVHGVDLLAVLKSLPKLTHVQLELHVRTYGASMQPFQEITKELAEGWRRQLEGALREDCERAVVMLVQLIVTEDG